MRITVAVWLMFTLLACSSLQGVQSRVTRPFQAHETITGDKKKKHNTRVQGAAVQRPTSLTW